MAKNNKLYNNTLDLSNTQKNLMNLTNVKYFLNNEITPHELSQVMDEAYYVISQMAIASPTVLPKGDYPTDELLHYLYKFRNVLKSE